MKKFYATGSVGLIGVIVGAVVPPITAHVLLAVFLTIAAVGTVRIVDEVTDRI